MYVNVCKCIFLSIKYNYIRENACICVNLRENHLNKYTYIL
jgi:hypothetical protein